MVESHATHRQIFGRQRLVLKTRRCQVKYSIFGRWFLPSQGETVHYTLTPPTLAGLPAHEPACQDFYFLRAPQSPIYHNARLIQQSKCQPNQRNRLWRSSQSSSCPLKAQSLLERRKRRMHQTNHNQNGCFLQMKRIQS